jgi:pimeloyl-ACP methyl ester carboxylesterase
LPFETLTPENMKYLTYEQALEDFAEFERTIIEHDHLGTKWISVGGSYPGALSAFYRQKYPNLVVGALSSSGVVRSVASFEDYDRMVAQGLGSNCLQAVQAGTQQIEAAINQPDQLSSIKKLFQTSDDTDALDLLSIPSNAADYAVQYGYQETFCNDVLSEAPLQGLAKASINISNAEGLDASPPSVDLSQDSWLYQSCTQFGGFVVPYHDPALRVQSSLLDLNYQTKDCQALFGISTLPPVDQTNKKFYAPLLDSSTSQILYVNGSMDPYSTLSISHINGNDINPNTKTAMVAGGSHCIDFSRYLNDPSALAQEIADVQLRFQSLAREWLASGSL